MKLARSINALRLAVAAAKKRGLTINFVPTMGALHEGHLSLIKKARQPKAFVVMSIFVNPLQFGPKEDFSRYPRTLISDLRLLRQAKVDLVFLPTPKIMYPEKTVIKVSAGPLGDVLCGRSRPGHFDGVATVVVKLFNLVQPDQAFFGAKDYQQQLIIRRLVTDLNFPIKIITVPTVREPDGLAMSSRNRYLSARERTIALNLPQALFVLQKNPRDFSRLKRELAATANLKLDYLEIVNSQTLLPVKSAKGQVVIAGAIYVGKTRLIDNVTARL